MDMLTGEQIANTHLNDWRKLGQGLPARYLVDDFGTGVRFVAAVGEAGDALGHHPRVTIGDGYVDLKLLSDDAVYRDGEGIEHVVEWVTQQDIDLARRVTEIAAEQAVDADPASITAIELALDTAHAATIAPVWAALLTGAWPRRWPPGRWSSTTVGHRRPLSSPTRTATGPVWGRCNPHAGAVTRRGRLIRATVPIANDGKETCPSATTASMCALNETVISRRGGRGRAVARAGIEPATFRFSGGTEGQVRRLTVRFVRPACDFIERSSRWEGGPHHRVRPTPRALRRWPRLGR